MQWAFLSFKKKRKKELGYMDFILSRRESTFPTNGIWGRSVDYLH
jgi:hypothetical protein